MPFAVFRRHQRKLLAIFAILAMFGFVLADSLPRLLSGGNAGGGGDSVVVEIYGKKIRRSDIAEMVSQRTRANLFMAELSGIPNRPFFGDVSTREIVDALILQHEADRLGMPAGPEVAKEWLKARTGGQMSRELFDEILRTRFGNQVTGEQVLAEIANQVRLSNVRQLLGGPVVTPLDVFQAFRDENERVSVRAVAFPVENYLSKVKEPTSGELQSYYEKYKDVLPDPDRDTPGFKVPRRIRVESLSLDGTALARGIRDKVTESELQSYYENRKSEFKRPSEFPDDLFADDPQAELTPPLIQSFSEVRPYLSTALADEKAQNEIVNKFGRLKDEVMIPFADKYHDAEDEIADAKKQRETPTATLPKPESLKALAEKEGLEQEITPLLTRELAEHYGTIGGSEVGLTRLSGGRKFAAEMFDSKTLLFEPVELTNDEGRRFLVRKIEDQPPRVPPLDEIRPEVILAWKTEQARPLAKQAAADYADKLRKGGGEIKEDTVDGKPVITTLPISKLQPGFPLPGRFFESSPSTPTTISQIPNAGSELRDAYFGLRQGEVSVAPNLPKSIYYALALHRRLPASFATLYAPSGEYLRYQREALIEAARRNDQDWMGQLRADAGLKPGWVPSDEANRESTASTE
jgi:hypothetical protein